MSSMNDWLKSFFFFCFMEPFFSPPQPIEREKMSTRIITFSVFWVILDVYYVCNLFAFKTIDSIYVFTLEAAPIVESKMTWVGEKDMSICLKKAKERLSSSRILKTGSFFYGIRLFLFKFSTLVIFREKQNTSF